jgi:Zn-dependent metalloprotease
VKPVCRCPCFALPRKLVRHLAEGSEPAHRERLLGQDEAVSRLRSQRAGLARSAPGKPAGEKPLHRQVFDAQGETFLPGKLLRDEDDPPVRNDPQANQAYENVGIAMQFYKTVLGRDSLDGKGMRVDASVHYGFAFANAMWTGEQIIVGDGDGRNVKQLAGSLGLIAHEFSHGVTQYLVRAGLGVVLLPGRAPALKGEAGALNESFSDVFASMIKQWHRGETVAQADWLVGEDILERHAGKAIRSLKDPGNRNLTWRYDDQIKDRRKFTPADEPHKASGIANHAFYVAASTLGGHSWEALAKVWYRGFDKLRSRATFLDAAHATVAVAAALHGKDSKTHKAVKAGWKKVNVLS